VTAAGAAGLGAKVALIERDLMGGDCLNTGCVPSKALLRCAHAAAEARKAGELGVRIDGEIEVDFPAVMERMRRLRAGIAKHDSVERFAGLGVDVFLGEARFTGPQLGRGRRPNAQVSKGLHRHRRARGCLPIPGLAEAGALTNETVFGLTELPRRLAVIGAGPIGVELSQAFQRFGSQVTLLEMGPHILGREDPDAAELVRAALVRDGVDIRCGVSATAVRMEGQTGGGARLRRRVARRPDSGRRRARAQRAGSGPRTRRASSLTSAAASRSTTSLRTTNPTSYAAGDVCFPFKFTHTADAMARIVIGNALFWGRGKTSALTIPWCTYSDPEIAHVGLYEHEAIEKGSQSTRSASR
jgi:pyruvate/2-oxoglutarate dehydrogenase complex dihydrolipoamide dehydrogenase (E3) component